MTCFTLGFGLGLAFIVEPAFNDLMNTQLNLSTKIFPDIIGYGIGLVVLLTFVSGLFPAIIISGFNPLEVIKGSFAHKVKSQYSNLLIIFQYVVAITFAYL